VLTKRLSRCPGLRVAAPPEEIGHSYYRYYVFVCAERLRAGWNRGRIMAAIKAEGIPCFSGICSEIYLEKAFPEEWRPPRRLQVAKELGETSLVFVVHPTLSEQDMLDMCCAVEKIMYAASK
jgi:dTDP-4-amino-4,6-dideoxygalactose transaminase